MAKITVYSTEPCSFCLRAKELLTLRELPFEEINLAKDPVGRAELSRKTGLTTFPQIVIEDVTIGGLDDLRAADESGKLSKILTA